MKKVKFLKPSKFLCVQLSKKPIEVKVGEEMAVPDNLAKMFISTGRAEVPKPKTKKKAE